MLVLSGATRDVVATWRNETLRSGFGHSLRSVGDIDGDGVGDVLVGFEFWSRTELRSGKDGVLVHAIDRPWNEVVPLGDFDGDGAGDVVLTTRHFWEIRSGRSNEFLNGRTWVRDRGRFDPVGDVDGDGANDLLVAFGNGQGVSIVGLSLADRSKAITRIDGLAPTFGSDGAMGHAMLGHAAVGSIVFGTSIGPFQVDVVAAPGVTDEPTTQATKRPAWPDFEGSSWRRSWADGGATSGVSLAAYDDFDGDGLADALVGSCDWFWHGRVERNGTLRLLSGASGEVIWAVGERRFDELHDPPKKPKSWCGIAASA